MSGNSGLYGKISIVGEISGIVGRVAVDEQSFIVQGVRVHPPTEFFAYTAGVNPRPTFHPTKSDFSSEALLRLFIRKADFIYLPYDVLGVHGGTKAPPYSPSVPGVFLLL